MYKRKSYWTNSSLLIAAVVCSSVVSANSPFNGNPVNLPGTIEAENYDYGGSGDAYYDASPGNTGGQYRNDAVDIEYSSAGGYNVGWFEPGEWLEYSVNVNQPGTYQIKAAVASQMGGALFYQISGATSLYSDTVGVPNTGNWQGWTNTSAVSVNLNAGHHVIRLAQLSGGFNVDSFTVSQAQTNPDSLAAYPGYTGNYAGFTLKLDDRFDNFNPSVWARGDGAVGGESDCRFQQQGVEVSNGLLELIIREEFVQSSWSNDHQSWKGDYWYSCGELRTQPSKRIKYGRIETRMKAPKRNVASGYISSLFTYVNEGSPREWEEIDIELEGGRPDKFQANLIYGWNAPDWNSTRNWGAWEHKIDVGPVDEWKVYAIEWTPNALKWFVDGVWVKTLDRDYIDCNPSCIYPQVYATPIPDNLTQLMMNFWIPNDGIQNNFGGNKWRNQYPMKTQYDWVRIYQLDSHPLQNW